MTTDQLFQFRSDILAALEETRERTVVARKELLEASEAQPGVLVDGNDPCSPGDVLKPYTFWDNFFWPQCPCAQGFGTNDPIFRHCRGGWLW